MGGGGKRGGDTKIRARNKGNERMGLVVVINGRLASLFPYTYLSADVSRGDVTGQGQVTRPSAVDYITDQLGNHQLENHRSVGDD